MAVDREALRDWHRLFGLLLTDFFTDSPFTVEIERDLSAQQQFLDVVILRRGRGRFAGHLPDGLDNLAAHNLLTFKSHHEALDGWAMKELVGHYVAYRKLVSPSPSRLLPEDHFRLYAVCARFPHNLSGQVPWRERQAGVYDCQWGTDGVRVIVGVGGLWPGCLPAAFGGYQFAAGATLREVSAGGFGHVVYDGGFQARLHQRAFPATDAGRAGGSVAVAAAGKAAGNIAVAAAGETPGGSVRRADPAIPGAVGRRPTRQAAQAATEKVTGWRMSLVAGSTEWGRRTWQTFSIRN
jgi:hypothetical protein